MTGIHSPSGKSADDVIKEGGADEKKNDEIFIQCRSSAVSLVDCGTACRSGTELMQVYAHVEQMINKGVEQYNNGDLEGAKKIINDSYYGVYENDGLEKAIRTTISSKNANLTEYQYSELKKAIRENRGKDAVAEKQINFFL